MNKVPSTKELLALLHKQSFRCAYSGDELTPENTSADHRVPVADEGNHEIENIALVTRKINAAKGTMSIDEFVKMCGKVYKHMGSPELVSRPQEEKQSDDPIEILARCGFIVAASKVAEMQTELASLRNTKKRIDSIHREITDDRIEERKEMHAKLQRDIASLQVKRSQLLSQTGTTLEELRS